MVKTSTSVPPTLKWSISRWSCKLSTLWICGASSFYNSNCNEAAQKSLFVSFRKTFRQKRILAKLLGLPQKCENGEKISQKWENFWEGKRRFFTLVTKNQLTKILNKKAAPFFIFLNHESVQGLDLLASLLRLGCEAKSLWSFCRMCTLRLGSPLGALLAPNDKLDRFGPAEEFYLKKIISLFIQYKCFYSHLYLMAPIIIPRSNLILRTLGKSSQNLIST